MHRTLPLPARLPRGTQPQRGRLARWWHWLASTADDAGLADAADLADLERRLQRLERGRPDRFGPLPP